MPSTGPRDRRPSLDLSAEMFDQPLQSLEPRTLMSADLGIDLPEGLPAGAVWQDWNGGKVGALPNSYVFSFDRPSGSVASEMLVRAAATRLGVQLTGFRVIGEEGWYARADFNRSVDQGDLIRVQRSMFEGRGSRIKTIEPNGVYSPTRTPNDPRYPGQWYLENTGQDLPGGAGVIGADMRVTTAWDTSVGSRNVIIGVIDSGVDINHEDLRANIWNNPGEIPGNRIDDDNNGFVDDVNGFDFGEFDNDVTDDVGHGTAVAGVIGAVGNNGIGVTGVNWNVSILPLKIADRFGQLTLDAIVAAHEYSTGLRNRGVNLVATNNSYRGFNDAFYRDAPTGFDAERDSITRFINSGGTFVAAAGNDSFDNDNPNFTAFPSSYNIPGLISVAATDQNDALAGFSNFGLQSVDLAAPGVDILTTIPGNNYTFIAGTSFSSPAVAGMVGLLKAIRPNASAFEIETVLRDSSDPLPSLQGRVTSGGRVNLARAVELIQINGPVVRSFNPGPVALAADPNTGTPLNILGVTFNEAVAPQFLTPAAVQLVGAGVDNNFGTPDDVFVGAQSVTISSADNRSVSIQLNTSGLPLQRLPVGFYELTLQPSGFRDTDGNFLRGNATSGRTEVLSLRIVPSVGDNEPNDAIAAATAVAFNSSGEARFRGATIGNGLFAGLDVDLYRIEMPRGGQITAETFAQRLDAPSQLDTVLRLFNGRGEQLAINDQANGRDSFVDFFVPTGGTYYIGVSGFGNSDYNINLAGSGRSQSVGTYDLAISTVLTSDDRRSVSSALTAPKPIPAIGTQGTTTDSLLVTDSRLILDVNLRLNITHGFTSDLRISLISPLGNEITLVNRRGGSGDNFVNTVLDDEGTTPIANAVAPFTGVFRPDNPLSGFDGTSAAGTWTLRIVDTTAINAGALISWGLDFTLENSIFGPFESNDTIGSAKPLDEISINGQGFSGSATRTAFLGDGGFGSRDRDMFTFTARAGASLTATVTSTGLLNSALRLFDVQGREIKLSNPENSLNSSIESFTFVNGGTFYLAVSETGNTTYDPAIVGLTPPATTTGTYTLSVSLAPGVSDTAAQVAGTNLEFGVSSRNTFRAVDESNALFGMRFRDIDFLADPSTSSTTGATQTFYGLNADGNTWRNADDNGVVSTEQPFTIADQSDSVNRRIVTRSTYRGLTIERTMTFGLNDSFVVFDVAIRNTSTVNINSLSWMEGLNPQQGLGLDIRTANTQNDLSDTAPFMRASVFNNTFQQGLTMALAAPAADTRALATFVDPLSGQIRDPSQILNGAINDPDGTNGDLSMALAYNLGGLAPNASTSFRYFAFFGETTLDVQNLYATLNNGNGTNHLSPSPSQVANEVLTQPNGSTIVAIPQLPYRVFYPEGFANQFIYTFVPILNPHDQPTRVVLVARNEFGGVRDKILGDITIPANSRGGFTLNTPELFNSDQQLVDKDVPYALELRADKPVEATFSYYDTFLLNGLRSALGESFTNRTSNTWTFGQVEKTAGVFDFVLFYNTTANQIKVTTTLLPQNGGTPIVLTFDLAAFRRGGWDITANVNIPEGKYGVLVEAPSPIVAVVSHFDANTRVAEGQAGTPGAGVTSGLIPEGQFGLNSTSEQIRVANAGNTAAQVLFTFIYANGSAYRSSLNVGARSQGVVNIADLPNFETGQPYAVLYTSNTPVAVDSFTVFTDTRLNIVQGLATTPADRAFTTWGFGEGFRPGDGGTHPGVTEYLRLFNPSATSTTVEITIAFDNGLGTETFRRTLDPRLITEIDVHSFVTGFRRGRDVWFGLTIKAQDPIVAYMAHYDSAFPGAFGTLGTPLGRSIPVV
jgi:subtilisin family serine protease/subtilisin-like proprotein convertase family protein